MNRAEAAARRIAQARAETVARAIEAEARAEFPGFIVEREGAAVWISGRGLGRLRLDDPLLANPAELAR